jgi:hypothetical protein
VAKYSPILGGVGALFRVSRIRVQVLGRCLRIGRGRLLGGFAPANRQSSYIAKAPWTRMNVAIKSV